MKPKSNGINWSIMADPLIIKEICASIKQMRLSKNLSQEQLAERSGLNRVTISRMEAGRAATILTIVQVLRALDKLDLLDGFQQETLVSPLQMFKLQQKQRRRASSSKKNIDQKEEPEW